MSIRGGCKLNGWPLRWCFEDNLQVIFYIIYIGMRWKGFVSGIGMASKQKPTMFLVHRQMKSWIGYRKNAVYNLVRFEKLLSIVNSMKLK